MGDPTGTKVPLTHVPRVDKLVTTLHLRSHMKQHLNKKAHYHDVIQLNFRSMSRQRYIRNHVLMSFLCTVYTFLVSDYIQSG